MNHVLSYRTPLCLLFPTKVIAAACFTLAQRAQDGPNSPSLDQRIEPQLASEQSPVRFAVEYWKFDQEQSLQVAGESGILSFTVASLS
jgi:cyclin K